MGMLLKNANDIEALREAIKSCEGDVILKSCDGRETFNMKSTLSEYIAISKLLEDHGDTYEFFCMKIEDEGKLIAFFHDLHGSEKILN
jgi:hypothetical protein